jgi:hypothetical protein
VTMALCEIKTSEADDGSTVPAECLWARGGDATDPGAIPVTALRHPAAPAAAVSVPNTLALGVLTALAPPPSRY